MKANAVEFTGVTPLVDNAYCHESFAHQIDLMGGQSHSFEISQLDIGGSIRLTTAEDTYSFTFYEQPKEGYAGSLAVFGRIVLGYDKGRQVRLYGATVGGSSLAAGIVKQFCRFEFAVPTKNYDFANQLEGVDEAGEDFLREKGIVGTDTVGDYVIRLKRHLTSEILTLAVAADPIDQFHEIF